MTNYQYELDKGSKKFRCPGCHKKTFVKFIDIESGGYLKDYYGRCDREVNCAYYLNPYTDGYAAKDNGGNYMTYTKPAKKSAPVFIPVEVLKRTLKDYDRNVFLQNLLTNIPHPFEPQEIEKIISLYYLGTVSKGYRTGAITFPYIDIKGRVRTIQAKQFDKDNHTTSTDFLHSIIDNFHKGRNEDAPEWLESYKKNDLKVSCLFGEHLLSKYKSNPIALVEAPKTAIYGSLYFGLPNSPEDLIWLAVYNLSSLNYQKCKVLQGRNVCLFPDLSKDGKAFELWSKKAEELQKEIPFTVFKVSDLLEKNAGDTERLKGMDLADYLIKHPSNTFHDLNKKKIVFRPTLPTLPTPLYTTITSKITGETYSLEITKDGYPANWDQTNHGNK